MLKSMRFRSNRLSQEQGCQMVYLQTKNLWLFGIIFPFWYAVVRKLRQRCKRRSMLEKGTFLLISS
jgi:hypothetical protein